MNKADANKSVMSTNNIGKYASAKKDSLSDSYRDNNGADKDDVHDLP